MDGKYAGKSHVHKDMKKEAKKYGWDEDGNALDFFEWEDGDGYQTSRVTFADGELEFYAITSFNEQDWHDFTLLEYDTKQLYEAMKEYYEKASND